MRAGPRYCSRCAAQLAHEPPVVCSACGYALWVNPRPTGSCIIVDRFPGGASFLAIRRAGPPRVGWWDLPGGFCEAWEAPADAAVREVREEMGLDVRLERFVGMYIGRYPYQEEIVPVLDCFWVATIESGEIVLDPAEATEHTWLPLGDPPEMAFATMDRALDELRGDGR